jgi:pantothenate kinase
MLASQATSQSDSICISNDDARYINEIFAEREYYIAKDSNSKELIGVYERALNNLADSYEASQKNLQAKSNEFDKVSKKEKFFKKGFFIALASSVAILTCAIIF